jgi:predicted RNA-binding Zn-ribbon protein involved in translation (DUF1610 family)
VERSDPKTLSQNRKTLTLFIAHIAYNDIQVTTTSEGSAIMNNQKFAVNEIVYFQDSVGWHTGQIVSVIETTAPYTDETFFDYVVKSDDLPRWSKFQSKFHQEDLVAEIPSADTMNLDANDDIHSEPAAPNEAQQAGGDAVTFAPAMNCPECGSGCKCVDTYQSRQWGLTHTYKCPQCGLTFDQSFPEAKQPQHAATQAQPVSAVTLDAIVALVVDQYDDNPLAIKANKQLDVIAAKLDALTRELAAAQAENAALVAANAQLMKAHNITAKISQLLSREYGDAYEGELPEPLENTLHLLDIWSELGIEVKAID